MDLDLSFDELLSNSLQSGNDGEVGEIYLPPTGIGEEDTMDLLGASDSLMIGKKQDLECSTVFLSRSK